MTQLAEQTDIHLSNFAHFNQAHRNGHHWLNELRQGGISRFEEVGFPGNKTELWRFTNVQPIARVPFKLADVQRGPAARKAVDEFSFKTQAAIELVFINGLFAPEWSKLDAMPQGVTAGSLAEAFDRHGEVIQAHLAKHARIQDNPFVALNTGFLRDGAFVHVARGAVVSQPIHLLFVTVPGAEPIVSHPRVLIVAEENSQSTVVESYVGQGEGNYFTNAVTEIIAAQDALVDHSRLQQETLEAFHISTTQTFLDTRAQVVSHAATLGGKLTRNDVNVWLGGEYAYATINGLVIIGGHQHCDNHTLLRHEKANCPSHELYKHILDGHASCVFKGQIFVQKDAQKTDSKQQSKVLLLSDDAMMNSQPALEIYADDVKCTHGSTTGPVNEDMVFYLRSRGVSLEAARHLLTYAFAADVTRRMKVEPVRRRLEDFLAAQHDLPQDLRITDLGEHDEAAR